MSNIPQFKVYDNNNNYHGCVKQPEMAAGIIACFGEAGWSIRHGGHKKSDTVWLEGTDGVSGESYDAVAEIVWQRIEERKAVFNARFGRQTKQQ